jgi:hypothetical protein
MKRRLDPATGTPVNLRWLERMTKTSGAPYSYEHLRKVLAGEPVQSAECNAVICRIFKLDETKMWIVAQAEKSLRRFGPAPVQMAAPDDNVMRTLWPKLTEAEQDNVRRYVEGLVARHEFE